MTPVFLPIGVYMAARRRLMNQEPRSKITPAQSIMMQILESAQVAIVAIFCIGIVCIATYAIAIAIVGVFAGPETGKLAGFAMSAIVGIASLYMMATNKTIRGYLDSLGSHSDGK